MVDRRERRGLEWIVSSDMREDGEGRRLTRCDNVKDAGAGRRKEARRVGPDAVRPNEEHNQRDRKTSQSRGWQLLRSREVSVHEW